jgi:hypothetical protein
LESPFDYQIELPGSISHGVSTKYDLETPKFYVMNGSAINSFILASTWLLRLLSYSTKLRSSSQDKIRSLSLYYRISDGCLLTFYVVTSYLFMSLRNFLGRDPRLYLESRATALKEIILKVTRRFGNICNVKLFLLARPPTDSVEFLNFLGYNSRPRGQAP